MKKILILGAKGMLGQQLVEVFKKDSGYKVIGWDRDDLDIVREKEADKKIGVIRPDVIINAAAYNAVDRCQFDSDKYTVEEKEEARREYEKALAINGDAPGYLAKIAKKNKAVLVHYSTNFVFDGQPEISEPVGCSHVCATCRLHDNFIPAIGFSEGDRPSPISKYGETKLLGEENVRKNSSAFYIIRLAALFGASGSTVDAKKSFFATILERGKAGEKSQVVDDEMTSLTYAPDLAQKTKEIIDSKKPYGIYHVFNSGSCTWHEAAVELYRLSKLKEDLLMPVSRDEFPRPAPRPVCGNLLNTKLNPLRDWQEALREYLKKI